MHTILLVIHFLIAAALIGLILLQRGKGADAGAAFGSGASSTVFGARGSASFLSRATAVLAALFFITSLSLAFTVSEKKEANSVTDLAAPPPSSSTAPAVPATPPSDAPKAPSPGKSGDVPVVPEK
jgi:preprotein translocase subunit SecG